MKNLSIKKGDTVLVISGKENGKKGKVKAVSPKSNKVIVENINIVSKHKKARNTQDKSQIIKAEAPFDASNVMVICPHCDKATRVAHTLKDDKHVRVCKKCGAELDAKYVKPKKETKKADKKAEDKKVEAKAEVRAEKPATKKTTAKATTAKSNTKTAVKKNMTSAKKPATKKTEKTEDAKKTTTKKASKKA